MKNLTDLPEETDVEIREKLHCYFSERSHLSMSINLLNRRIEDIDAIVRSLIDKSAQHILKKHGIKPVKISLG